MATQLLADVPKRVVLPALAASAAYINSKYNLSTDLWNIKTAVGFALWIKKREKADRMNLFYLLQEHARNSATADRPFIITPSDPANNVPQTETTYAQAYDNILRYAAWLKAEHGVEKGEMVAMDFTNKPQFVWMWFALWSLGAVPAFINHNLRDKAFLHCVQVSTARTLLIDEEVAEVLTDEVKESLGASPRPTVLTKEVEAKIMAHEPFLAPAEARSGVKATDLAMLIYTSGTTGLPKAANVNWGKPASGPLVWGPLMGLKRNDRYFTALPLYHSSGSFLGVMPVLGSGCTLVLSPKFSARQYMRQVSETGATGMHYIGEMCRYLVSSPPSPYDRAHKLKFAYGNGLRPDVWQKLKDRFNIPNIVEFYGATEGPSALFVHSANSFTRGAVGHSGILTRTLMSTNILVKHDTATDEPYRNAAGFCEKVKTGETGELLNLLDAKAIEEKYFGYLGNEKATNSKILRNVLKKGDAWYRTGDLQRMDADGRWWFMDRIGDTFRWKSENVSTAEVSEAVGDHPDITEANCYGVQLPNHDGRAGCAALVLRDGLSTLDSGLCYELAQHSKRRLPKYAVPLFLRVMRVVETTGTHKHQKVALRNAGVDPAQVGGDEVFWLLPGAEAYERFGEEGWKGICAGEVKL